MTTPIPAVLVVVGVIVMIIGFSIEAARIPLIIIGIIIILLGAALRYYETSYGSTRDDIWNKDFDKIDQSVKPENKYNELGSDEPIKKQKEGEKREPEANLRF